MTTLKSLLGIPDFHGSRSGRSIIAPPIIANTRPSSEMNRDEQRYWEYLKYQKLAGEIVECWHEPDQVVLGHRCVYIPDFRVKACHGGWEYHEVKGWMQDDAKVKLAVAAVMHPDISFILAKWKNKQWKLSTIDNDWRLKGER